MSATGARSGASSRAIGRAISLAWLGWRFAVVQPLRRLLPRPPARARFAANWFGEGLVPTSFEERELALAAAACTGCGLCEPRCEVRTASPALGALGLQSLFRLHAKHLGELPAAAPLLAACEGCRGCDDACPSGVPIARILRGLSEAAATRRRGRGP